MNINIIVAICKNNGIGINNTLPWRVKSDMIKFKNLTIGNNKNAIIMGKNTWTSINSKGLPNRDNLILSSTINIDTINTSFNNISKSFNNIEKLEDFVEEKNYEEVWIMGGEKIYNYFLNEYNTKRNILKINKIVLTYIDKIFDCDTFFPDIDANKFKFISKSIHNNGVESYLYDFNIFDKVYERKL